jgi:hypothetical protein
LYQQENFPVDISRRQLQYAATVLHAGGPYRTPRMSSGTQTTLLNISATSQSRPVIIQSPADTQMSPQISCGEAVRISVCTQTVQATNFVSAEDKRIDTGEMTDIVKTTESTQTDSLVQVSAEIQTEKLLTVTEVSKTGIPTEHQVSASSQTEDTYVKVEHSEELGTPVSTQTISLDMNTISTETEHIEVASVALQTEGLLQRTFVTSSNLESSPGIQKNVSGSRYQSKSHLSLVNSSNVPEYSTEENNSTPLPTAIIEPDTSLEEFTELKVSVGTQTVSSSPFPSTMVSPMRQFQFSITTVFPSGSLLSRSSPVRSLLMPLGMIFF